jgi:hypothetical protein
LETGGFCGTLPGAVPEDLDFEMFFFFSAIGG